MNHETHQFCLIGHTPGAPKKTRHVAGLGVALGYRGPGSDSRLTSADHHFVNQLRPRAVPLVFEEDPVGVVTPIAGRQSIELAELLQTLSQVEGSLTGDMPEATPGHRFPHFLLSLGCSHFSTPSRPQSGA